MNPFLKLKSSFLIILKEFNNNNIVQDKEIIEQGKWEMCVLLLLPFNKKNTIIAANL